MDSDLHVGKTVASACARPLRAAFYVRVSTADQHCELQLRDLRDQAARQGWEVVGTYQDVMSGAKASRPALNKLMSDARAKRFDCLLVWKLDRFRRSLVDCLNNLQVLENCGIRFIAVTQGLDMDERNPVSKLLLHVLGAAAEFERSLILGRTRAGQTRYREAYENGEVGHTVHSRSGRNRPPHRPSVSLQDMGELGRPLRARLNVGSVYPSEKQGSCPPACPSGRNSLIQPTRMT